LFNIEYLEIVKIGNFTLHERNYCFKIIVFKLFIYSGFVKIRTTDGWIFTTSSERGRTLPKSVYALNMNTLGMKRDTINGAGVYHGNAGHS